MDWKKVFFVSLFFVLALLSLRVNFIPVYGATGQYLTVFGFFSPIAGGFLGAIPAILVVLAAEIVDVLLKHKAFDVVTTLRLFPALLAVWFFHRHKFDLGALVTALGIAAWLLNPIGREVWFYSLLFVVPLLGGYFKNLWGRSFGAAFASFVAGQVLWLYLVPTTPADWVSWIPVVIYERTAFSLGIAASFVAMNTLLSRLSLPHNVHVDKKYDLLKAV